MKHIAHLLLLIGAVQLGQHANAQGLGASFGLIVYPSDGQAASQQAKDEGECYAWGKTTTGVDPANPMAGVQSAPPPRRHPRAAPPQAERCGVRPQAH